MRTLGSAAVVVLIALGGCASGGGSSPRVVAPASADQERALLERMKSLDGEWQGENPETHQMATMCVFKTTSAGSAVREVMFPGQPHEMTNMYHMDGDSLVVTHYCAMGNQPRMRAKGVKGDTIKFEFEDVTNKTSEGQACMGDLRIEFKDADHVVETWRTLGTKEGEATVIELTRKR
jgi:hypothetical protein